MFNHRCFGCVAASCATRPVPCASSFARKTFFGVQLLDSLGIDFFLPSRLATPAPDWRSWWSAWWSAGRCSGCSKWATASSRTHSVVRANLLIPCRSMPAVLCCAAKGGKSRRGNVFWCPAGWAALLFVLGEIQRRERPLAREARVLAPCCHAAQHRAFARVRRIGSLSGRVLVPTQVIATESGGVVGFAPALSVRGDQECHIGGGWLAVVAR